jgi:hypothetical protein
MPKMTREIVTHKRMGITDHDAGDDDDDTLTDYSGRP